METDSLWFSIVEIVAFLFEAFVLFFIGKLAYQLLHRKFNVQDELVEKDNLAFAIAHTGYFIGILIAMGGVMLGPSHEFIPDLLAAGMYGALSIVLVNISIFINDKVILNRFSNYDEIVRDRNSGVGMVEAASAIATGMVVMGAVYGEGGGIDTAVAFWAAGQVLLVIAAWVYNLITPYNVHQELENDNVAAGVGFAGALIAIGNLIRVAIQHDFDGWIETFSDMGVDFLIGIALLPIARLVADKILLPGRKLTDEIVNQEVPNIGAGVIEAFAYIGGSVLIGWLI